MVFEPSPDGVGGVGAVHVVAAGSGSQNRGIWYVTNGSGQWIAERLTTLPTGSADREEYDGEPSIALAADGSVWIAFTRWECRECAPNPSEGVFVMGNPSGSWSDPVRVAKAQSNSPSLDARDGAVHLAYAFGMLPVPGPEEYPTFYGTDAGGGWTFREVAGNADYPQLSVGPDGLVQVLHLNMGVRLATAESPSSAFAVESVYGDGNEWGPLLGTDTDGRPVAAWTSVANENEVFYSSRFSGSWSPPVAVMDGVLQGLVVDGAGTAHLIASSEAGGLVYTIGRDAFAEPVSLFAGDATRAAMAVDPSGRPHVTFTVGSPPGERGIWYMAGTGD